MKKFIVGLLAIMITTLAIATERPFLPHEKDLIDKNIMDLVSSKMMVGNSLGKAAAVYASGQMILTNTGVFNLNPTAISSDGISSKRVARATWDFAVDGGAVSAIDLGVTIPANALINFVYFYTVTQVTDGGAGTGALHCEDANNLFSAADITGNAAAVVVLGVPQNGAANMVKAIAADCALTWTIATAAATAGKLIFFVEYTIVE